MPIAFAILVLAIVAAVVVALMISRQPDTFSVRRSAVLAAPPDRLWALLVDFHRWTEWSPWEGRDPAMKREYSGAQQGVGAVYGWQGNKQVGQGRMEITGAQSPSRLDLQLDFLVPFEAHNRTVFTLTPQAGGTRVDWEMTGPANFMTKAMLAAGAMDRMVGKDFEQGLRQLGAAAA